MRNQLRLVFIFLLICVQTISLFSQQYNIKAYTTKEGLAQSYINHISRDSKGYLWMSTQGGISRFDGKKFKTFTSKEGLPGSDITYSCEDKEGNIWIATNGYGVSKFNGSSFKTYNSKNGLKNDVVYCIFPDSKNNIWFATFGGITKFDGKKFTTLTKNDGLPTNEFFTVEEDKFGNIWFGTRGYGLVKYDGKKFTTFTSKDGLSDETIFSLYNDNNGRLWIGTASGGVCIREGEQIRHLSIPNAETEFIGAIREDKYGNIWLATDHQLIKYANGKITYFREENGLTSNSILSLGIDMEGNLWVGTDNGVDLFKNEAFVTYTDNEKLSNNKATAVLQDSRGNLLIGTSGGGITVFSEGEVYNLNHIPQVSNSKILCFYEDSKGNIWFGADSWKYGAVMLEYKNNQYQFGKNINTVNNKKFSSVTSILEDKFGNIWIAVYGSGVVVIKENEVVHYNEKNIFPKNDIMTMMKDSKQNIWISINQEGVIKYDYKTFKTYSTKNGLGDNTVYSMAEAKNGDLIFGNYENGITVFNGRSFQTYTMEDGLCSNLAQALICDQSGYIWIGTDKGINKIRLGKDGRLESVKYYNEANGLKGLEINQNAFYIDNKNYLWIGTINGLTKYDSKFDYLNETPPSLVFNDIKLNFQTPDWKKLGIDVDSKTHLPIELVLNHRQNHLSFDFQAITTDNVKYQYILEGLDNDWTPLTEKTEAVYANIPPGEYTFRVKAINSDGTWSKEELTYKVTILPPYWQTWWFRISIFVLILLIVIAIFRWRTAQLAKEKKILEIKVQERTVELSHANSQLSVAIEDIKDSIHYAKRIQDSILPNDESFYQVMKEAFVLFKPKDIVSGDFYWVSNKNGLMIYATCDCTGHGVPGGFMTMLGSSFLNEIVHEKGITQPDLVLNLLRDRIIDSLKQTGAEGENKDGMDMVICVLDKNNFTLTYAAANNGFYILREGNLIEQKPDKQPIGYYSDHKPFTGQTIKVHKGDLIYTFTDGYADQFGGPKGKKFKYKQLEEILIAIHQLPIDEQRDILDEKITSWIGEFEQLDDICLLGLKV